MGSASSVEYRRNDRIVVVRLLCIVGLIYVHVPSINSATISTTESALSVEFAWFDLLRAYLIEGYGRTSACLLSVVSGYLVSRTMTIGNMRLSQFYCRKFKSIYIPMVVWGVITLFVFSVASLFQENVLFDICGAGSARLLDCANVVFHLSSISAGPTIHLAFLRDLFVCILLAPLLLVVLRYMPVVLLSLLALAYLFDVETILVLRPLVILGFSVGLTIGLYAINYRWVDRYWQLWLSLALLLPLITIALNLDYLNNLELIFSDQQLDAKESFLYPLTRLFGALAIWTISLKLVSARVLHWSEKLGPVLFVAFCSHPVLLSVLQGIAVSSVPESIVLQWYPFWFLFAPVLVITVSYWGMRVGGWLLPALIELITGGRAHGRTEAQPSDPAYRSPKILVNSS